MHHRWNKQRRFRWLGHVFRMEGARIPKVALRWKKPKKKPRVGKKQRGAKRWNVNLRSFTWLGERLSPWPRRELGSEVLCWPYAPPGAKRIDLELILFIHCSYILQSLLFWGQYEYQATHEVRYTPSPEAEVNIVLRVFLSNCFILRFGDKSMCAY